MNKIYPEHVAEAADRVSEIKAKITACDERIAYLQTSGAMVNPLTLATDRRAARTDKATLTEALAIAEDDLKDITAQLKAFEKASKDGGAMMVKLEAKQAENITAFFQALDAAWDKAVEAAKIKDEATQLNGEYAGVLPQGLTYHGQEYAQDVDKILSFVELNQPESFKAAGIKNRHARGEMEAQLKIRIIY